MQCPGCGAAALKWSRKRSDVTYRDRTGTAQRTHAMVRVATCATCGFAVRPPESLMAEHSAICRHIGVLAPEDIVAARQRLGITQVELAERTGFGIASIKRWETGRNIQNLSSDRALRSVLEMGLDRAAADHRPSSPSAQRRRA
jgi:DNA-binding transcriptional regulator YiaG